MAHPSHDGRQHNKVYLNPNFNHEQKKIPVVHFNPAFGSKIFVNPNFVSQPSTISNYNTASQAIYTKETFTAPIAEPSCSNISSVTQALASKSRFSLTRHANVSTQVVSAYPLSNQHVNTATIIRSKYSIQRCTNNTTSIEVPANLAQQRDKAKAESLMPFTKSRFKLTRAQENVVKPESKMRRNSDLVNNQKMIKQSRLKYSYTPNNKTYAAIQSRHKNRAYVLKCNKKIENLKRRSLTNHHQRQQSVYQNPSLSKMKKNNIPCPLFTKFGQCLRKDRGSCCFLHDKKHVRLCKKFLKGLCFNDNCLLSHTLSSQKMPTCHFYLKGVCVKENCPYLHVKLNEDAKICKDFLKGYCEKGENCLNRHYSGKSSSYSAKRWTPKANRKRIDKKEQLKVTNVPTAEENKKCSGKQSDNERYYRDQVQASTSSDAEQIKPSRCKLGLLPSFIKL